jgi:hypothetical protein
MEVKTYTEPGEGLQQCPSCRLWLDEDCGICACGHNLTIPTQAEIIPEIPTQKPKPKVVEKRAEKKAEKKAPAVPAYPIRLHGLRIPSGANPVPLRGNDKAALIKWAEAVRAFWLAKGYFLKVEGLGYYLMWENQFEDNEKALEAARAILEKNLSDETPTPG